MGSCFETGIALDNLTRCASKNLPTRENVDSVKVNPKLLGKMEKPRHELVGDYAESKLPKTEDLTLLILKGHLLIERVVEEFIAVHIVDREAFDEARLSAFQKIQLAIAIEGRLPPEEDDGFWDTVKKLNKLRNTLAHKLTVPDVEDQVRLMIYGPSRRSEFDDQRPLHVILRELIGGLFVYLDAALESHAEGKRPSQQSTTDDSGASPIQT